VTPIICFTSDFGLGDTWVGVCHATIYRTCPQAKVVDLAHRIPPFDIRKAAVVASSGVRQLPEAVHLVVVDPGVGGGRSDVCLVTKGGTRLVGPDNGVLIPATWYGGGIAEAYVIDPHILRPDPPLATFHARDVMAPAVAALASGVEPSALGGPVDVSALADPPFDRPTKEGETVLAEVLDTDRFGSVRLGVSAEDLVELGLDRPTLRIELGHLALDVPLSRTFSDVGIGDPVALVDSSGWLTIAVREESASERYAIEPGTPARIHATSG
jgi:S-adenosylmethionine hydrolase